MGMLDAALEWAQNGVPVFPCDPVDKSPLTKDGFYNASTDRAAVEALFAPYGENCLIGARMGGASGLFAIDFDLYKPGVSAYMERLSQEELLAATQVHLTRSGGLHFIYRHAKAWPNVKPVEGVEVKGEGGYIIVPPSEGYSVETSGIVTADDDLVNYLMTARRNAAKTTVDALKQKVLNGDDFHDPLVQIAARRSAQGWDQARVQKELLETMQGSLAADPGHERHARWKFIMENKGGEFSRIASSSHAKYNHTAQTESARENATPFIENLAKQTASFFSRPAEGMSYSDADSAQVKLPPAGEKVDAWPFAGMGYFSSEDRDILNQKYVMYPLFAERETVLMAAEPKAGKTAVTLKMCMNIAAGESFGDSLTISEPRDVLYFTLEGARAVEMRIAAEREQRKRDGLPPPEKDRLFVVDRPHNMSDPDLQARLCEKIILHDRRCQQENGSALGVIVIDTLTKAMPGKDQNSVDDTSQLFHLVDILRSHGLTCTVVFVHHLSKEGKVRGSSNIEAEVDVVLSLDSSPAKGGLVRLVIRRARSIDESTSYNFKLTSFYLGTTAQGHKLEAPVVTLVEPEVKKDTVSEDAKEATEWAKINTALTSRLGKGKHSVLAVAAVLVSIQVIKELKARAKATDAALQKDLATVFDGKVSWSFGNFIVKVERRGDLINGVEILQAQ